MKKIFVILTLMTGLMACENQENEFPDFAYTVGYFPYQYPVRTLVLGDYIYDNTNDNNHKFLISAAFGGVYANKFDRQFEIEIAEHLSENVLFKSTSDTIRLLPPEYYSLSSSERLIIPAGEVNGSIEVQLTDAFFEDTLAVQLGYIIPLRIVNVTNIDSVLRGKTSKLDADPRVLGDWDIQPKDFTMFAVKFINPYHGKYLRRGASTVKDAASTTLETTVYRTKYIVDNEIWSMITKSKNQVSVEGSMHSELMPGTLKMDLTFSDDGSCIISETEGSAFVITGSGKFVDDGDEWGNKKRDAIHINYELTSGGNTYSATDTLVIRDRDVTMEVYSPLVY